jgi:hypothetical protein
MEKRLSKDENKCVCNSQYKINHRINTLKHLANLQDKPSNSLLKLREVLKPIKKIDYSKLYNAVATTQKKGDFI